MARKQGSHSEITGPRVREAAQRLIARHGYAAVSMRQIAAEVGVQAGALYLYTPDKQTMLFDLMKDHLTELLAAWDEVVLPEGAIPRLEAFVRFHIRFHLARPEAVVIAYMEMRNLEPENHRAIEALRHGYEDRLEKILIEGQGAGDFQIPDTRLAAMALLSMLNGIPGWFREDGRLSRGRVERIYWNMIRRAVGA
ncbi:TetR/AcrR family transcriptional regulator [Frigidibacter sp. ROC022]|uniref:TetR/AcrR family transcriptional regulator n=1 Tax=Frigidibacter sp. ROC022 TaxID=2971796 RepID=UPI00215B55B6|nr:TetR/AcrR family transcriptional regulator [Frigidibacter sp. ROC022]MCR8723192.1 TetR/AcrR family transcriptional regulator [Frigidibacter sp. ROC022]